MLDFRKNIPEIKKCVVQGILSFEKEYPNVKWSMLALDSCPWMGFVAINIDTQANSDSQVRKFQSNGSDWYGEDEWGKFNDNCADFEFVEVRRLEMPEWEKKYNSEENSLIEYIDVNGSEKILDLDAEGDWGFCRIVFELLKPILLEVIDDIQKLTNNRGDICRVGVQLYDSDYKYFEVI